MVFFNHATRQMTVKIVYYGPGLGGKTTNLSSIYQRTQARARGEMVSLNTETDRTLFFDLLPLDAGLIRGFKARLQLYTVPGQVFYNATRKLVLKGVDGIVFVADSQAAMLDANRESLRNLEDNLRELGLDPTEIPMVFQWNKRDLEPRVPTEVLEKELNPRLLSSFPAMARDGAGVFETLRAISRLALDQVQRLHLGDRAPFTGSGAVPGPVPEPLSFLDLPAGLDLLEFDPAAAGGPPAIRMVLPPELGPGPLEVQVRVRRNGQVVAEAEAPLVSDVLTLAFKRS
jgi:hypothetical protein